MTSIDERGKRLNNRDVCFTPDKNGSSEFTADRFEHELVDSKEEETMLFGSASMHVLPDFHKTNITIITCPSNSTRKTFHGNPWCEKQNVMESLI